MAALGGSKLHNSAVNHFDSSFVGLDGSVESGLVDSLDESGQSSGICSHSEHSPDSGGTSSTDASVYGNVLAFSSEPLCMGSFVNERSNKSKFVDALAILVNGNSFCITYGASLSSQGFLLGSSGNRSSLRVDSLDSSLSGKSAGGSLSSSGGTCG